jgi:hypothetical protein
MRLQGGGGKDRISLHILSCQAWDVDRVGGKHEAAGRRWKRQEISAHTELPGLGCGQSGGMGSIRLQGGGGKREISAHSELPGLG